MVEEIKRLAEDLQPETIAIREFLHAHPELSFKEYDTTSFIAGKIEALGIPFERVTETGIVALIKGTATDSDRVTALRADIDALPIQEENEVAYRSTTPGVMHACGHDVHTASLLATLAILQCLQDQFSGTVKCIFQPAEEKIPGGARAMIEAGVLNSPSPRHIIGQHVMPELKAGKAGFYAGRYMASSDELYITVHGKGGHGAMPHLTVDPVSIACQLVGALQQFVSRQGNPLIPSVLSVGRFIAPGAPNVIPDKVELEGTFRTMDETWRLEAHRRIDILVMSLVKGMGGHCDLEIRKGYPALENDKTLTAVLRGHAEAFLGREDVVDIDPWMAAEDFAYYTERLPACFYRLGVASADGMHGGLHTPTFDADARALVVGPGLMAYLALKDLGN